MLEVLRALWNPVDDLLAQANLPPPGSESPEVLLKRLQLALHRRLGSPYPGDTLGLFKGHGMDLQNLREYQPGDEIRKIDWNVFARTGVPHVKEHYEEKQVAVWFFVDCTAAMHFGQRQTKLDYAKQLVALLGSLALEVGHRVGLILWQGTVSPQVFKPHAQAVHLQWLLQELDTVMKAGPLPLSGEPMAFPHLPTMLSNRALVFLLSDFAFLEALPQAVQPLSHLSPKHQVHSLLLVDPVETDLVYGHGWLPLGGGPHPAVVWVNTSDRWLIKEYRRAFKQRLQQRQALVTPWSRLTLADTGQDPIGLIAQLVRRAA